ncbi:response regulator transcription factor [Bradyrhizobium sp. Ai1a-2]|uniref:response regulator transcription factor n=1 Tax=Bradyrhizobium sp. Ai1a-2 TaxID=196490 RepID=UPI0006889AEE|nr:response regulator transcription factor [Bradyrhizobium sp. Ai1a-2]
MRNSDPLHKQSDVHKSGGRASKLRVYIVSYCRVHCEALKACLDRDNDVAVVGTSTFNEVAHIEIASTDSQFVLLDLAPLQHLPRPAPFLDLPEGTKLIAVGIADDDDEVLSCAEAGFSGYVPFNASLDDLRRVIREADSGQFVCSPGTTAALVRKISQLSRRTATPTIMTSQLTARQREIAALLGRGLTNKEIARRLCICSNTVRNHVHAIFQILDVSCRAEAVSTLHANGYQAGISSGKLVQLGHDFEIRAASADKLTKC